MEVCICDGGSEGSVKDCPMAHKISAGGRMGWEWCRSGDRGPIVESRRGGVLGFVAVSSVCVAHTGIADGRIGWDRGGSGNRGPIVDTRLGGVIGVVVGAAEYVE